jgi:tetratricopeptide (TPR) repeat protein
MPKPTKEATMKSAAEIQTLANLAEERGDYAKAARLHQKALVKMEREVGKDQPELVDYLFNVGMIKCALDDREAAQEAFTKQLDILLQFYPAEHIDIVELRQILSELHSNEEVAVMPLKITA